MRGRRNPRRACWRSSIWREQVPPNYGLRAVKRFADRALAELSRTFDATYGTGGRPWIPPQRLLKSSLLITVYSVRSERAFCEQLTYDLHGAGSSTTSTRLAACGGHRVQPAADGAIGAAGGWLAQGSARQAGSAAPTNSRSKISTPVMPTPRQNALPYAAQNGPHHPVRAAYGAGLTALPARVGVLVDVIGFASSWPSLAKRLTGLPNGAAWRQGYRRSLRARADGLVTG
jgi:hypothetical protein